MTEIMEVIVLAQPYDSFSRTAKAYRSSRAVYIFFHARFKIVSTRKDARKLPPTFLSTALPLTPPQAYHSIFLQDTDVRLIGTPPFSLLFHIPLSNTIPIANLPLLPLRTRTRGPAYTLPPLPPSTPAHESPDPDSESYDALDEILSLYRANTFFRNFEIKGPADRLLIYGILCVGELLGKVPKIGGGREGEKVCSVMFSTPCVGRVCEEGETRDHRERTGGLAGRNGSEMPEERLDIAAFERTALMLRNAADTCAIHRH